MRRNAYAPPRVRYSDDRARALVLAKTGDYTDWKTVCRKMMHEGWDIAVFNDRVFTDTIDATCQLFRAGQSIPAHS